MTQRTPLSKVEDHISTLSISAHICGHDIIIQFTIKIPNKAKKNRCNLFHGSCLKISLLKQFRTMCH